MKSISELLAPFGGRERNILLKLAHLLIISCIVFLENLKHKKYSKLRKYGIYTVIISLCHLSFKAFAPPISFDPHDDSCSGGWSTRTCPSPYNPLAPGITLSFLFPSPQLLRSICDLRSPTTHIIWTCTSPHLCFCVWQIGCHWWGLPDNWDGSGCGAGRKEEGRSCYHGDRAVMPSMPSFRWLPGWKAAGLKGRAKNPCCA